MKRRHLELGSSCTSGVDLVRKDTIPRPTDAHACNLSLLYCAVFHVLTVVYLCLGCMLVHGVRPRASNLCTYEQVLVIARCMTDPAFVDLQHLWAVITRYWFLPELLITKVNELVAVLAHWQ